MERESLSYSSLKDQPNYRQKDSWKCNNQSYGEEDGYLGGFLWPPRCYTCSFCKREFKSAQALGGHMNVHRRDRARLRQLSPPRDAKHPLINLNLNPNPNPCFSSSSSQRLPIFTSTMPSPVLSSPPSSISSPSASPRDAKKFCFDGVELESSSRDGKNLKKLKGAKSSSGSEQFEGCTKSKCRFFKKTETTVRLDLGIGLLGGYEEDLDLELRLGYS